MCLYYRFGITAGALLKAKTLDWDLIPKEASHLRYDDVFPVKMHDRNTEASDEELGGWSTDEIAFPGYKGQCEIAELNGKAVAEDPSAMVKHFLLTTRPVIIRDFLRYDKGVSVPILHFSSMVTLISSHFS